MIALFCLFLALSASPFKSKNRLAAENAALRHQLIVLQRRVRCAYLAPGPAGRQHHLTRLPRWTASPLRPRLSFRYTHPHLPAASPHTPSSVDCITTTSAS